MARINEVSITIADLTEQERATLRLVAAQEGYDPGDYVLRRWTSDGKAFTCTDDETFVLSEEN